MLFTLSAARLTCAPITLEQVKLGCIRPHNPGFSKSDWVIYNPTLVASAISLVFCFLDVNQSGDIYNNGVQSFRITESAFQQVCLKRKKKDVLFTIFIQVLTKLLPIETCILLQPFFNGKLLLVCLVKFRTILFFGPGDVLGLYGFD